MIGRDAIVASGLHLVVPGPLDQRTGGYLYDARMAAGLERLGWKVVVHNLEGVFPTGDALAEASLARTLADIPTGARVLVDGLAMGALPRPVHAHRHRLRLLGLVHHPLADEAGLTDEEQRRLEGLEREALAACAGVIVTSSFTVARLEAYGVPRSRVRRVRPGVDSAFPARGPAPGDPPALVCVGTVIPRKGQDVLVRALNRIRDLPWTCLCAGSLTRAPDFVRTVCELSAQAGLTERIVFVGELGEDELDNFYDQASVFVLPSHYEGYGMALAEALVRGLPIVSTSGGAIPETVPPGTCVLVPPGDDLALAEALRGLLSGPEGSERRDELAASALFFGNVLPNWDQAAEVCARAIVELTPDA